MAEESNRLLLAIEKARKASLITNVVVSLKRSYPALLPDIYMADKFLEMRSAIPRPRANQIVAEAKGLLKSEFLGDTAFIRISKTPPFISFAPGEVLDVITLAYGSQWRGMFLDDTNHLIVHPFISDEETLRDTVTHELLHYASWLGGGGIDFDLGGDKSVRSTWMHEGITELFSRQLLRKNGFKMGMISYPAEQVVGFYVQQIAGADALREAYFSGDFSKVREIVDSKLGAGTLEAILGKERGAEALEYLSKKLLTAKIDIKAWDKDPIVAEARSRL